VARATATASELGPEELRTGATELVHAVGTLEPKALAVLGIGAYRTAFDRPRAALGRQPETIGRTVVWVLPNPSGLNAHHQLPDLAARFRELRDAIAGT
jgi:TDG/mug DNA glycosylase family protein